MLPHLIILSDNALLYLRTLPIRTLHLLNCSRWDLVRLHHIFAHSLEGYLSGILRVYLGSGGTHVGSCSFWLAAVLYPAINFGFNFPCHFALDGGLVFPSPFQEALWCTFGFRGLLFLLFRFFLNLLCFLSCLTGLIRLIELFCFWLASL